MIAKHARQLPLAMAAHEPSGPSRSREDRILLIRPDHLGDLLFLTPALKRFRQALPAAHITLAVGPWGREIVQRNPAIDEVLTLPFPGFTRRPKKSLLEPYQLLAREARNLNNGGYRTAVILRDDHWWGALLAERADIPVRVGSRHDAMLKLLTHTVPLSKGHWVERNVTLLDFAAKILGDNAPADPITLESTPLDWVVDQAEDEAAAKVLSDHGVPGNFVVIHPGSGAPVKLWPVERWATVASRIITETGSAVLLTGSHDETSLVDAIQAKLPEGAYSLAGKTDIATLAAVYRRARFVAGVDSGPLHLAVAVRTPSIHLYGPSLLGDYGPWGPRETHHVVTAGMTCPRCGDLSLGRPEGAGCMLAIETDDVLAIMRETLARG